MSSIVHAQELNPANKNLIEAKRLANKGNIDSAILTYELAFSQIEYVHSSHIGQVLSLSKQNKDKARIKKYKQLLKDKKKCKNTQLMAEIDSILKWDGKIRKGYFPKQVRYYISCNQDSLCDKNSKEFQTSKIYYDSVMIIDSLNQTALLNILKKEGGYKGEASVGSKNEYGYYVLLLHYDTDTNNRILQPYLDEAFKKGYITSLMYTYVLDRHEYYTMGTQNYWAWPLLNEDPNLTKEQISDANDKREKMGVSSRISTVEKKGNDWLVINK
jgi:hypothetical protein